MGEHVQARRERLRGLERLGFVAARAARELADVGPLPSLPIDLARRVQQLAEAASAVAALAEREIRIFEEAADWAEGNRS